MAKHLYREIEFANGKKLPFAFFMRGWMSVRAARPGDYREFSRVLAAGGDNAGKLDDLVDFATFAYGLYLCGLVAKHGGQHALNDAYDFDKFVDNMPDDLGMFASVIEDVMPSGKPQASEAALKGKD